jgi:hypothetical protein
MSSQHPDQGFRITTARLAVRVNLIRGEPLEGEFSCAGRSSERVGGAELAALLNQPTEFVPFFPRGHQAPVLLGKRAVRLVCLDRTLDRSALDEFGETRALDLLLDDGMELRGEIRVSAPLGHTRTLDNLNEAGRFLVLRTDKDVLLVNLAAVVVAADAG